VFYPDAATLGVTGAVPAAVASYRFEPAAGSVVVTGLAPLADATNGVELDPSSSALTVTSAAPVMLRTQNHYALPAAAALTHSSYAAIASVGTVVQPGAAAVTTSAQAAVVSDGLAASALPAELSVTSLPPTAYATHNRWVDTPHTTLTVSGFDTALLLSVVSTTDSTQLAVTLNAPTASIDLRVHPDSASLLLEGGVVVKGGDVVASPGTDELLITSLEPVPFSFSHSRISWTVRTKDTTWTTAARSTAWYATARVKDTTWTSEARGTTWYATNRSNKFNGK
jgi:hypothetical protein